MNLGEHVHAERERLRSAGSELRYVLLGQEAYRYANDVDRVLGPLDEVGGTTPIFHHAAAGDDHVELSHYTPDNPGQAGSSVSVWAPGLDAAALEVYQTLRADGVAPAEAREMADLTTAGAR